MRSLFVMLLFVATGFIVASAQDTTKNPNVKNELEPAAHAAFERAAFNRIISDLDAEVKRIDELHKTQSSRIEKSKVEMLAKCEACNSWFSENGNRDAALECARVGQHLSSISVSDSKELELDSLSIIETFLTMNDEETRQLWAKKNQLAELELQLSNLRSYEDLLLTTFTEIKDELFIMESSTKSFAEVLSFSSAEQKNLEKDLADLQKSNKRLLKTLQIKQSKLEKAAIIKFGKETGFRTEHSDEIAAFKQRFTESSFSPITLTGYELKEKLERLKFNLSGLNKAVQIANSANADLQTTIEKKIRTTKHLQQ